jgi:hypothetical protein
MTRSDHDRLLREMLVDENLETLRTASLEQGVALLRRRRRRRVFLAGATASLMCVAVLLLSSRQRPSHEQPAAIVPTTISGVKLIDDEQLLALFPDRTVALVGAPGRQELVFIDPPKDASNERKNR